MVKKARSAEADADDVDVDVDADADPPGEAVKKPGPMPPPPSYPGTERQDMQAIIDAQARVISRQNGLLRHYQDLVSTLTVE